MLASPSSSAPTLYGFPAGRPFRVIGHQAGFAQIKDLRSGATGWIDEAALAPPPNSPAASTPSQPRPVTASGRPAAPSAAPPAKATKKDTQVTASPAESSDQLQTPKRPGLFGRGGLFGGIFGGGNGNANGNAN
jgi:cell division septation protein DedD